MASRFGAGRALGQKIGNMIEKKTHEIIEPVCSELGYRLIPKGKIPNYYGKLVQHDGLIVDNNRNPHIIIECKYVQKAKHATEKAAKVSNEHPLIKKRYPTLKGSFAVLAGDFTPQPRKMVTDSGGILFFIDKDYVDDVFSDYGITVRWEDRDTEATAPMMHQRFLQLSEEQKNEIANKLMANVRQQIIDNTRTILTDTQNRLSKVGIEIFYSAGNIRYAVFNSINEAREYLRTFSNTNP